MAAFSTPSMSRDVDSTNSSTSMSTVLDLTGRLVRGNTTRIRHREAANRRLRAILRSPVRHRSSRCDRRSRAIEVGEVGRPICQQRIRMLLARQRAAANETGDFGAVGDVAQLLADGLDTFACEVFADLGAGEVRTFAQGVDDHVVHARAGLVVQTELPVLRLCERVDPRPSECEEPTDVVRGDEMPGRPQNVGAENVATGKRFVDGVSGQPRRSQREGPFRGQVFLGLDASQAGAYVVSFRGLRPW